MKEIENIVLKYALANAVKFDGKAIESAVISKVLGERPDLRPRAREIVKLVRKIVSEVNKLPLEEQRRKLAEIWPEAFEEKRREEKKELPPLPQAERFSRIVTRFAPNPDFVLHLGSARPAILSYEYARKYNGRFILRFEDTDPKTKPPIREAYDLIREDLMWLKLSWDEEYIQSLRLEIYYQYARKLLEMEKAYVCIHSPEDISRLRREGKPCSCVTLPSDIHLDRWDKMLSGEYGEKEAVLRIKTDIKHPNPSVRDWIAFRIIDTEKYPHPLVGSKYIVWPTYNFACAIDDHLLGVTHILRGEEHAVNTLKQEYIYRYFDWSMPVTIHFGRMNLEGTILSKSLIRKGLERGLYSDWSDIRLGTLIALRRRGILPEAIWELVMEVGIKPSAATISIDKLHAINRKILEPRANRYMFVPEPLTEVVLKGIEKIYAEVMYHPSYPERGYRVIESEKNVIYAPLEDLDKNSEIRFISLGNFRVTSRNPYIVTYISSDLEYARENKLPIIQWAPVDKAVRVTVLRAKGDKLTETIGYSEPEIRKIRLGEQIQFIRFGFVKLEKNGEEPLFIYTHS